MFYLARSPWWLKKIYPGCVWQMPGGEKKIYLSFDDGPHPIATPFVLEQLKAYNAKATFFCIGKNVAVHPALYKQIIEAGHSTGNHTYDHLNGWKTENSLYIDNVMQAKEKIVSPLFRPPYGRATKAQLKVLKQQGFVPVMWSVLSGDFDKGLAKENCLNNVLNNTGDGSIVVFHDSEKALEKLRYALPKALEHFSKEGFCFCAIDCSSPFKKIGPE